VGKKSGESEKREKTPLGLAPKPWKEEAQAICVQNTANEGGPASLMGGEKGNYKKKGKLPLAKWSGPQAKCLTDPQQPAWKEF